MGCRGRYFLFRSNATLANGEEFLSLRGSNRIGAPGSGVVRTYSVIMSRNSCDSESRSRMVRFLFVFCSREGVKVLPDFFRES